MNRLCILLVAACSSSLLAQNATSIQGTNVSSTPPTAGQALVYSSTGSQYAPALVAFPGLCNTGTAPTGTQPVTYPSGGASTTTGLVTCPTNWVTPLSIPIVANYFNEFRNMFSYEALFYTLTPACNTNPSGTGCIGLNTGGTGFVNTVNDCWTNPSIILANNFQNGTSYPATFLKPCIITISPSYQMFSDSMYTQASAFPQGLENAPPSPFDANLATYMPFWRWSAHLYNRDMEEENYWNPGLSPYTYPPFVNGQANEFSTYVPARQFNCFFSQAPYSNAGGILPCAQVVTNATEDGHNFSNGTDSDLVEVQALGVQVSSIVADQLGGTVDLGNYHREILFCFS